MDQVALRDQYVSWISSLHTKHFPCQWPNTVWHYTSGENFLNILQNGEIWFSHVSCLNDSSEFNISIDHTKAAIERRRSKGDLSEVQLNLLLAIEHGLAQSSLESRWHIACFSEAADDLGQWRAYGGGDGGVALGFDRN